MTDLAHALDKTRDFLTRYVVFASPEQAVAIALWIGLTWVYDQWDIVPYLAIQSPEKRSGKTLLQDCIERLVRSPLATGGASMAAVFRAISEWHPTVIWDELDAVFNRKADANEDVRGLLNNGYRRGRPYLRVVGDGKKMRVEQYDVFAPMCLASIRALPDTVQDRSIVIAMQRRLPSERVERFRSRRADLEATPIRESWEALAETLQLPESADVPDALSDRAQDSWEPLLAIADAAGAEWPERGRRAALVLSGVADVEDERTEVRLLADIRSAFAVAGVERLASTTLLETLNGDDYVESGWSEWHGRPLTGHGLGRLLRPFGIRSKAMKIDGPKAVKGFELDAFADVFARYLPPTGNPPSNGNPVTAEHDSERGSYRVTEKVPVTGEAELLPFGQKPVLDGAGEHIDCADMTAHYQAHRYTATGWVCDACSEAAA